MHNSKIRLAILVGCMALSANLWAKAQPVQATLAGHAILPAKSAVSTPKDAPGDLQQSGKYTSGKRVTELGSVAGKSAEPDRTQPADQWSAVAGPLRYQTHARRYLLGAD